jgi:hypothetical protein
VTGCSSRTAITTVVRDRLARVSQEGSGGWRVFVVGAPMPLAAPIEEAVPLEMAYCVGR